LHLSIITAVEVGEIKREIAYHGDTINTAARTQRMCNQFCKDFLYPNRLKRLCLITIHNTNLVLWAKFP